MSALVSTSEFYLLQDSGNVMGPVIFEALRGMLTRGEASWSTLVACEGDETWSTLAEVDALARREDALLREVRTECDITFRVWHGGRDLGEVDARTVIVGLRSGRFRWSTQAAEPWMDEWVTLGTYADVLDPTKVVVEKPAPVAAASAAEIAAAVNLSQAEAMRKNARSTGFASLAIGLLNPQLGDAMLANAATQGQLARQLRKQAGQ
ncbi:MAG: GYF domain-containing protein [Prosthecobacter sp.]